MIVLCLLSCLIGLYRLQTSEFKSLENQSTALKTDAKHLARFLILALPFFTACSQAEKKNTINKQTVRSLNLDRYLGKWYEIARTDNRFETWRENFDWHSGDDQ